MEIHFFYIHKFRNIKDQPVTLSSKYLFLTEIDFVKEIGEITIIENKSYIKNFFENYNVSNVTALIGKNGTGKTSIFNYILENFPRGLSANAENNLIVIYSKNNGKNFEIVCPDSLKLIIHNKTNVHCSYDNDIPVNSIVNHNSLYLNSDIKDIDFIYYNYFLDYKINMDDWHGIFDISTSSLLCKASVNDDHANRTMNNIEKNSYLKDLDYLMKDELFKSIQLLLTLDLKLLPFKAPSELFIPISKTDDNYFIYKDDKNRVVKQILINLKILNKHEINKQKQVENEFYIAIFLNFFVTELYYSHYEISLNYFDGFEEYENYPIKEFVLLFFANLRNVKYKSNIPVTHFEKLSSYVPIFIKQFEDLIKDKIICFNELSNTLSFKTKNLNIDTLFKFITLYFKIKRTTGFLDFKWRGLSTGQQLFLSFMSRFHHIKLKEGNSEQLKENIVILIDEGDAGFHPAWQKRYFNESLKFLSKLFSDKNVQIIFASNTPYLISDLSNNHIVYLKENEKNEIIITKNDSIETFAQNIHTLLSDSFFLEDGLIGDFAKLKLDKIIEMLTQENNELSQSKINEIANIINIIGEPVIKFKLTEMFERKFNFPLNKEKEIIELESRLKWLRDINYD